MATCLRYPGLIPVLPSFYRILADVRSFLSLMAKKRLISDKVF